LKNRAPFGVPFITYAMRRLSSHTHPGGTIPPGHGVLQIHLEIIMSYNAQAGDMPALPEVEEVSINEVEAELLTSSHFCDVVWILFAGNTGDQAVMAA
tara:strand:+ start:66 stop:359 length:294 start_codon:yes stop_codon:yes gene_type:complete